MADAAVMATADAAAMTAKARMVAAVAALEQLDRETAALTAEAAEPAAVAAVLTAETPAGRAAQFHELASAAGLREARVRGLQALRPHLERERDLAALEDALDRKTEIVEWHSGTAAPLAEALGRFHAAARELFAATEEVAKHEATADCLLEFGLTIQSEISRLKRRVGALDRPEPEWSDAVSKVLDGQSCTAHVQGVIDRLVHVYGATKAEAYDAEVTWCREWARERR